MKYSIGYQLPDEYDSTYEICRDYSGKISEVFFSWGSEASGRLPLGTKDESEEIESIQLEELKKIKKLNIKLALLMNANCYGEKASSTEFAKKVTSNVAKLKKELCIDSVTTASPFVAEILKCEFADSISIRASVNMRIGSVRAMEQLSRDFDGFYLKKEANRRFNIIDELHSWCSQNGKTLHLLANSGCLTDCAFQTYHDNLVAHQSLDFKYSSQTSDPSPCYRYLKSMKPEKAMAEFMASNWIRPEDIHLYEKYFDEAKLATRMHSRPRMVVAAYCRERFTGNLLDLTEPSYSGLFKGNVIDNTLLPPDWFANVLRCNKSCSDCRICSNALEKSLVKY